MQAASKYRHQGPGPAVTYKSAVQHPEWQKGKIQGDTVTTVCPGMLSNLPFPVCPLDFSSFHQALVVSHSRASDALNTPSQVRKGMCVRSFLLFVPQTVAFHPLPLALQY